MVSRDALEKREKAYANSRFFVASLRVHAPSSRVCGKRRPGIDISDMAARTNTLNTNENVLHVKSKDFPAKTHVWRNISEIAPRVKAGRKGSAMANDDMKNLVRDDRSRDDDLVIETIRITSPDKVLYEADGITKGEVAAYYQKVSARMLPYIQNRILSEVRCPGGIRNACFYRRHPDRGSAHITAIPVTQSDGGTAAYYYITDTLGLLSEVQMGTVEFHTWGSPAQALEQPDMMVFDLDPDEGLSLAKTRQGVRDIKTILDRLSLTSYLKTSGGKGYHIVIPFKPGADWGTFHAFSRSVVKTMEAMWPDRYTANVRKDRREGRVFIDWLRNSRGATSVAPYCVRARAGAPVSMPIGWEEVDSVTPGGIDMAEAVRRLDEKDPWAGFSLRGADPEILRRENFS